ncbi:GldG family protein [Alteromonas lipotrueiana]|uniref:GldG family protein n=1 Tax=Alteromonas lipotrueiana TaxID=2803815 RepID=UPI001C47EAB8|nr:Gldg family protein [Alteromonas lipotrueiana]
MRKITTLFTLLLVALLFIALVMINHKVLDHVRLDLTESKIYTLSKGSREVIDDIDEPVTLHFFFSDDATKGMTSLRNYAARVESVLREYEKAANGKIRLNIVDPEPFSEEEDRATQFGLTGATLNGAHETVYFGLAATNMLDDQFAIRFFDPQKESFLEYELSKLLHQLSKVDKPVVALVSDLPVAGGQNPMSAQFDRSMVFYEQLTQLFNVVRVPAAAESLPANTSVVMLAHPKQMSESLKYAVDQFAMKRGRVIAFVDPHYESDMLAIMGNADANSSDTSLLRAWGIEVNGDEVLLDSTLGLDIRSEQGDITQHPGFIGLGHEQMNSEDVITANLESINLASAGTVSLLPSSTLDITPLLQSSAQGYLYNASNYATQAGSSALKPETGSIAKKYTVAGHVSGTTISAFSKAINTASESDFKATTDHLNVLVVADADMLTDRFWVQQSPFFGDVVFTPFANNGDFVINAIENLAGGNALISIRGRGQSSRPFTRVEALQNTAQQRFTEHEQKLQDELAVTEAKLAQLQSQQGRSSSVMYTDEQQSTVDQFVEKRVAIRKQLREVRYELDRDIDQLGGWIKFINIALAPLVLIFFLYLLACALRLRPGKAYLKG